MTVAVGTGGTGAATGTIFIDPTLSSAANQTFAANDPATATSAITITNRGYLTTGTVISAANELRVKVPAAFTMVWDTTDTSATITGGAATKVYANGATQTTLCSASPCTATVAYEDAGKTLVVYLGTDWAASDTITIADLTFTSFTAGSAADNLELEVLNDDVSQDEDDKTITITGASFIPRPSGAGYPAIY